MNRIHGHHISPPVTFLGNNSIGKLCQEPPFRVEKVFCEVSLVILGFMKDIRNEKGLWLLLKMFTY